MTSSNDESGGGQSKPKPAYSVFTKTDLEANIVSVSSPFFTFLTCPEQTSLQAEIESLQTQSAERRAEKIRAIQHQSDVTMSAVAEGIVNA